MEACEKGLSRSGRRLLSSGKRRMKASDLAQDVNVSRPTGLFWILTCRKVNFYFIFTVKSSIQKKTLKHN